MCEATACTQYSTLAAGTNLITQGTYPTKGCLLVVCALCLPTSRPRSGSRSFGLKDDIRVVLGLPATKAIKATKQG